MGMPECAFEGEVPEALLCPVCCCVLESPVRTPCGHTYCRACICGPHGWLRAARSREGNPPIETDAREATRAAGTCPTCRAELTEDALVPPDLLVSELLGNLKIRCAMA